MSDSTKGNLHALVVDSEPNVRECVARVLQAEGWNVAQSASGEEALARADELVWSAIFFGVSYGGADGYKMLRQFKQKMPDVKVVLVAGHGNAPGQLDEAAYGAYDYLLKLWTRGIANPRACFAGANKRSYSKILPHPTRGCVPPRP